MQAGESSFEIGNPGADGVVRTGRQQGDARQGKGVAARRSRSASGMHRNSMRENRETPLPPGAERQQAGGRTR
jgi:hypothetical protein